MCGHACALGLGVGAHVHPVGDFPSGSPRAVELCGVESGWREAHTSRGAHSSGDGLARQGGLEVAQCAARAHLCRSLAGNGVDAQVIGVPVAAGGVVADEDGGPLGLDEVD